ncbi:asparagine synthase (glutamine-hydrolyzing) [Pseudomonas sp. zfem004]|uniref:asparagine synthase (glutamine-hydrolyzing) n=1 Tax=unclassified Pseudomonas TaxID=196821 RepID=UPI00129A81C3|nr:MULTISPECIES: asparagine synthase (glutamine-hydrolyzing) [unclassified Pseudomonas]MDU9404609.1 asparagine synthase (glutamine-hydrolyzing) [Pseudomonas sp. zfem004]
MCGILGGAWFGGSEVPLNRVDDAIHALRFRGPNDNGKELYSHGTTKVALGHTRLSIIDLSSGGHQPMSTPDYAMSIVFNGEIYNYRELRAELQGMGLVFRSDSDTEVLLAAWKTWGVACLKRLVGMFAFVVFDHVRGTLTCVRDAFGIKPFFYAVEDGNFLFASELTAVKAMKAHKVRLDWQRAYDYLVHGDYDSNSSTFFEDVSHLLPGHILTLDLSTGELSEPACWWTPTITERKDLSFDEAAEQVREQFLSNIRLHLRSDVALGAALSGGIDSSAVVCAMRHVEPDLPINTFSYIARGSEVSEEVWVDRVNEHVGAVAHKVVVSADELARDLDSMILAQGEPFGSTSIYAQYRVFQLAREQGVTVTLDGQGADEMLAGYSGYPGQRLRSLLEKGRLGEAWSFLNEWAQWPGRDRMAGAKRAVAEMTQGSLYQALRSLNGMNALPGWINAEPLVERGIIQQFPHQRATVNQSGRRVMAELGLSLTRRGLPGLLRHGDRNSMRFSVESRVPFLTLDMVDLLLSMPESYLISPKGETKSVFRAAMRGIVPDDVLDRRDKIGFATPEQVLLASMIDTIRGWLTTDLHLPFFNQAEALVEFELIMAGKKPFSWQVWRWINFCRWHEHFIA